ncbi:hypothetical protein [Flavihumibacter petaseus]|nr:hypothetical protein [Flavihumibacter petaseus]
MKLVSPGLRLSIANIIILDYIFQLLSMMLSGSPVFWGAYGASWIEIDFKTTEESIGNPGKSNKPEPGLIVMRILFDLVGKPVQSLLDLKFTSPGTRDRL